MECKIFISDKKVKELLGDISPKKFASFCKKAVVSKIFRDQFKNKKTKVEN